ncbi:hypothetical protein ACQR3P_28790 [Rhodococcus sp. IEGM1300]
MNIKQPSQHSPSAVKLIEASSGRHIIEALKNLSYDEGLKALDQAILQTEDDVEVYLNMNMDSLAATNASLLSCLIETKDVLYLKEHESSL